MPSKTLLIEYISNNLGPNKDDAAVEAAIRQLLTGMGVRHISMRWNVATKPAGATWTIPPSKSTRPVGACSKRMCPRHVNIPADECCGGK